MNTRFLLFLMVLLMPSMCFAQGYEASTLSVFSDNGEQFFLVLNGVNQNNAPSSRIRVEGLPQYNNDVEILFADNRTPAIRRKINIADPVDGKAVNMVLKLERDRAGYAKLKFHKCTEVERDYRPEQGEYVMSYGRPRQGMTERPADRVPPPPPPAPRAMDPQTFGDMKQTIHNASFDETKLSTAKAILAGNYANTDQVIEVCKLFSFEDSKLAFAKYAYDRTVDASNYFKVSNVFSFSSSKEELNNFISGRH